MGFDNDQWPFVSVVMSLYNEAAVISDKLDSLLKVEYPPDRLAVFIGSDASSDQTNQIVGAFARKYPLFRFYPFEARRGKPLVINDLVSRVLQDNPPAPDHVLLITDANVLLTPETLHSLARHFSDPEMAIVDAHMVHTGMKSAGISKSENQYISGEVALKNREGLLWGAMIGPFGGCYAVRSDYFHPVPPNFLVDDFFIAMKALEKGGKAVNDLEAICYEGVSHQIQQEYRRKARIAAGNFQNLATFFHLWWPPITKLGFAFFSHKVLRWFGPFFLLTMLVCAAVLWALGNLFFGAVLIFLLGAMVVIPLLDYLFQLLKINILLFRNVRYFVFMNIALLEGFFRYFKGIKNNVWEPVNRQQS